MKWSEMYKTVNEDDLDSEEDDSDEHREPIIRFESVPHRGAINRVRAMHGSSIVATWNEDAEVGIYNVAPALEELDQPVVPGKKQKTFGNTKVAQFKHRTEGFALEWSPHTYGRLASGTCDAQLWLYQPADEGCSQFVKETQVGLQGHKHSIEDI